jgi:hypothetical protein
METLKNHHVIFLPDASPMLAEVVYDYDKWQRRSPQERDWLTGLLHNYQVGEDWQREDSMRDVCFTPEEIKSFSSHLLVVGDRGLPLWYGPVVAVAKALNLIMVALWLIP